MILNADRTRQLDPLCQVYAVQEPQRDSDSHHVENIVGDAIPLLVSLRNREEFLLPAGFKVQALSRTGSH
jgi:hypothetical protein